VITLAREDGFTITEMLVSTTVMLLVMGAAMTTFQNALKINDSAAQLADANQNLRAGTNQLIRDLLMAGRIIGAEGIAMPTGPGAITFARPGPSALTFDLFTDPDNPTDPTLQLPSVITGYHKGDIVNGNGPTDDAHRTDIVTILTVDEFMPIITTPPQISGSPRDTEGTIAEDGTSVTLAANSLWLLGDPSRDTAKIQAGDLILFKGQSGNAIQTVTSKTSTQIKFEASSGDDFFHFNQPNATNQVAGTGRPLSAVKQVGSALPFANGGPCAATPPPTQSPATVWCAPVTLFRAVMITYYVDNTTTPGTPRLTRIINHCPASDPTCPAFSPQALAGVVEDLDLTYDLKDGLTNPTGLMALPCGPLPLAACANSSGTVSGTFNSGQIRKVNVHVGVRSEALSKPSQDYVRNHISTSVEVRSLASNDRYKQ
jgi:type II secretory pathway pseudopilin PulG